jgi:hypothetical protein
MEAMKTYLCIGPQCWGKGEGTGGPGRAVANAKQNWPRGFSSGKNMDYDLWLVPESAYIDYMGTLRWDTGDTEPVILKQVRFDKAGKRSVRELKLTASQMRDAQRGEPANAAH